MMSFAVPAWFSQMCITRALLSHARMNIWIRSLRKAQLFGANCTVICGVTIGRHAFVGAGTLVNSDIPDYALVVGMPGKQVGWMSRYGEQLDLPLSGNAETLCPHTGDAYRLVGNVC